MTIVFIIKSIFLKRFFLVVNFDQKIKKNSICMVCLGRSVHHIITIWKQLIFYCAVGGFRQRFEPKSFSSGIVIYTHTCKKILEVLTKIGSSD